MRCKKCQGLITLEWDESDLKTGLFVIRGECELCHAKYVVPMQLFEQSKLKVGARLYSELAVVATCQECPMYLTGEHFGPKDRKVRKLSECNVTEKTIKDPNRIPRWCPLEEMK